MNQPDLTETTPAPSTDGTQGTPAPSAGHRVSEIGTAVLNQSVTTRRGKAKNRK